MEKSLDQIGDFVTKQKIKSETQFKKILEEIEEYDISQDPKELADIVITCLGYAFICFKDFEHIPEAELPFGLAEKMDFAGACIKIACKLANTLSIDLKQLIREKVEINANRTWEIQKDGTLHHV